VSESSNRVQKIVWSIVVCGLLAVPADAQNDPSPEVVDSQGFTLQHMTPAAPPASEFSFKVNDLLQKMTLKEKIGQMTQLELSMITSGLDQNVQVDPSKLHKAIADYSVGSILNVNLQALPAQKWQEIIRAIQDEAQKTRLKIPVLYGLDTIHGANYVAGATLFPQPLGMAATWNPEVARSPPLKRERRGYRGCFPPYWIWDASRCGHASMRPLARIRTSQP